jgi:hypothetical protein
MKNILFLAVFLLFVISACKDEDCGCAGLPLPQCIEEMIADTSVTNHLQSIQRTTVGNEQHFWLNSGASAVDGPEFIVNEQCDTVCYWLCFCEPPACADDYDINDFEVVWEK